jgi:PAS domain S-box-containing protein
MANERILVVDDQPMVAQACAEILAEAGYRVGQACGGREALAWLEAEPFDLLLADLKMPDVDGLTVLRRARELYPAMAAVMITSYATLENAIQALRAGARDFLLKPFDPDDLVQTVGAVLAVQQQEQETLLLRYRLDSMEENLRQERDLRQALQAAETLYHNLVETSQNLIWQCNTEGKYTYLNLAWQEVLGYELEEMLGKRFSDFQPPEDSERDMREFARLMQGGSIKGYETVFLGKDGSVIYLVLNAKSLRDENGNITGTQGTAHEIGERKRIEEKLRQSEEDYRQLFEAASDAIFLIDNETGQLLQANNAACTLYGYSREEILSIKNTDLSAEPEQTQRITVDTRVAADQVIGVPVRYHRRKDGTVFPVEITGRFFLHQGRSVHIAAIRDITERQRAAEQLKAEKAWSEAIISAAPNLVVGLGERSTIVIFNEFAEISTGYTAEEVMGREWIELFIPQEMQQEIHGVWDEIVTNLQIGHHYENLIVTKTGEQRLISWHNAVLTEHGKFKMMLSIGEDITERKQAEAALHESEERYRSLVENAPDAIYVHFDERLMLVNQACLQLFGARSEGELLDKSIYDLFHRDSHPIVRERVRRLRDLGKPVPAIEEKIVRLDGGIVDVETSAAPFPFSGSSAVHVIMRDITERKQAEDALREVKELNESIVQTVSEGIVMTDELGTVTFVNPALERLLGYAPDELVGQNWSLVVPPDQWPITLATRERRRAGQSDRYEQDLLGKDGTRLSVLIGGSPRFDATTGSFAGTLSVITDFTERKQGEEALQQRAWQLALLNEIGSQVAALLDLDQVLDRAAQLVQERFGFHYVTIFVRATGEDRLEMRAQAGEFVDIFGSGLSVALGQGMIGWVGLHGETLLANDVDAEPRYFNPIPDRLPTRSELSVPIRIGDEILGVLDLQSRQIGAFDSSDVTTLETLASQIATAINNARLYDQVAQRNRELTLLNRVIAATTAAVAEGMEPVLDVVCREMALAFEVPQASAALLNKEKTEALVVAEYVALGVRPWLGEHIPLAGVSLSPDLLSHNAPLVIDDAQTDPLLASIHDLMRRREVGSLLLLPLVVDGDLVGSLVVDAAGARRFTAKEVALAQRVTEQVSGALARAHMAESQQRLSIAIEQSAESVIITDTQGAILYVNPAFTRVSGYSREEVLGQNPRILKSDRHDNTLYRDLWQTITAGQIWRGQMVNRGKDGSLYTLDAILTPVYSPTGEISNYVATMRDVTRELQLEEQFLQAQKMEAVGRLAGGVAHDFNNLLTVIHLSTRMLERKLLPEDPLTCHVLRIQEAGQRGANLTRQLLAFSRREIVDPQVLDLNQVLENLDKMLRRLIGEDVEMALLPADSLWAVQIDPTHVEQVVVNLAVNARDAMPSGGRLIMETANVILDESYADRHLEVEPGEYVLLTVSDDGEGMSEGIQAHIFEPFFTTKEKGKGTGLGLATVFGIVKQSGGHIRVYSEVGVGTTFKIYLPRVLADAGATSTLSATHAAPAARGSETLLLVEDESGLRDLVRDILSVEGYRVLTAPDGVEALQIAGGHEGPIHILVTDVVMPHMSGKELADRLGSTRPEMRVLFTSGYTDDAIAHHGVLAEGVHFLSKPFEMEALIRKVRDVLDGKR